jgi:NitT/TauT family transport system ATP-binding protein
MTKSQNTLPPKTNLAVEVLSASKLYKGGVQALLPINLEIKKGEFVSLLGPSGCGKSTLLKLIAGLSTPSSGSIKIWNQDLSSVFVDNKSSIKRDHDNPRISFVFQSPTLMPWATVRSNVRLPLDLAGINKDEGNSLVDEALSLVGLSNFDSSMPRVLSGGMQMRVSIARGLITKPNILLMDEPFGALDEITRHKLDEDLLNLWQNQGLTIVFVTHSIHEAVFLSNRVVMMAARPGRITEEFKINEPYPRSSEFMMTSDFMDYAKQLQKSLLTASVAG